MLFDKIIDYFKEKTFEKLHIHIIERLILLLKAGKSAQTSTIIVFDNLTNWQKATFIKIGDIFEVKTHQNCKKHLKHNFQSLYFRELEVITRSPCNVIEQLKAFREVLRLHNSLRHRSRQALRQNKAQALISFFIYLALILLSKKYLNLELMSLTMFASVTLFSLGQIIIFKIGGKIHWKT